MNHTSLQYQFPFSRQTFEELLKQQETQIERYLGRESPEFLFYLRPKTELVAIADARVMRAEETAAEDFETGSLSGNVSLLSKEGVLLVYDHVVPVVLPLEQITRGQRIGTLDDRILGQEGKPHLHVYVFRTNMITFSTCAVMQPYAITLQSP